MNDFWETGAIWGLFFLRFGVGLVFVTHGYPKMTGRGNYPKASREHFTESIRRLGLPFPFYVATFLGGVEFFGGAMVMLGLWTRWAALALAGVMLVATSKTFFERGFINAADFPFSLLTSLLALMFLGGGSAGLEGLFFEP